MLALAFWFVGLWYLLLGVLQKELAECLERDGFKSVADAIGADHRPS